MPGIPFARDHLGRGAGRDESVEAGNRSAGDGDETEWKDFAGEDGSGAVDEFRKRWELELRMHANDSEAQQQYDAEFDEGAEVVAGGEQHPDWQRAGEESINDHGAGKRDAGKSEPRGEGGRGGDGLSGEDAR